MLSHYLNLVRLWYAAGSILPVEIVADLAGYSPRVLLHYVTHSYRPSQRAEHLNAGRRRHDSANPSWRIEKALEKEQKNKDEN